MADRLGRRSRIGKPKNPPATAACGAPGSRDLIMVIVNRFGGVLRAAKGAALRMTHLAMEARSWIWLAVGYRDYEFQGGVGWAEAGDFDVGKAATEARAADVMFGDGLLSFGIDDPEGGTISERAGSGFDAGKVGKRIGSKKDPGRRGGFFVSDYSTPLL